MTTPNSQSELTDSQRRFKMKVLDFSFILQALGIVYRIFLSNFFLLFFYVFGSCKITLAAILLNCFRQYVLIEIAASSIFWTC